MYTPTFAMTAELAMHEFNARGGVLGNEIELVPVKVGPHALRRSDEVTEALERAGADGVIVCHDSNVRELVIDIVRGRAPVFYPPIWEGGAQRAGVICTGEDSGSKTWPAIRWLAENASASDWMIVGTDYRWPSGTARAVEPQLRRRGWWHGTHLVPYSLLDDLDGDERVVRQLVDAVEASTATCVLVLLHGSQMAMFNREFASRGLDERVLRFAPMADESVLLASGPETTRGLLTAFGSLDDGAPVDERGFLQRYRELHGALAPTPTGVTLAGYEGVAVASAIALGTGHLRASVDELSSMRSRGFDFEAPTGRVSVRSGSVTRPMKLLSVDGIDLVPLATLS